MSSGFFEDERPRWREIIAHRLFYRHIYFIVLLIALVYLVCRLLLKQALFYLVCRLLLKQDCKNIFLWNLLKFVKTFFGLCTWFLDFFLPIKKKSRDSSLCNGKCRKYACLNCILYLLWLSGDIELNPGPRKYYLYEVKRKMIKHLFYLYHEKNPRKKHHIWNDKPSEFSANVRFYNPFNAGQREGGEDDKLLDELVRCCEEKAEDQQKKIIPDDYQQWIDAWKARKPWNELIEIFSKLEGVASADDQVYDIVEAPITKAESTNDLNLDFTDENEEATEPIIHDIFWSSTSAGEPNNDILKTPDLTQVTMDFSEEIEELVEVTIQEDAASFFNRCQLHITEENDKAIEDAVKAMQMAILFQQYSTMNPPLNNL